MIDTGVVYTLLFISLYFEVFILVAFLERRFRSVSPLPKETELPSVAIVVPCYNEARTVAGTIASLFALDYPAEKLEIVVVDDGSRDGTFSAVKAFEASLRSPGSAALPSPIATRARCRQSGRR